VQSHRSVNRAPAGSAELGFLASFRHFFERMLDEDKIIQGNAWLEKSRVQQQLEFEGFQLRWVQANRVDLSALDGWDHVTVPHYLCGSDGSGDATGGSTSTS
jgi:hypothetical protein